MNELVQQAIDTLEFLSSESDVSKWRNFNITK